MTPAQAGELFRRNGFEVPAERIEALVAYERLLLEWNAKINLVSRRDTSEFFIRHIVGSISFLFAHSLRGDASLLDVGTGGGLPGIPLAILHPGLRVTMIDSIRKKTVAVGRIIEDLGLSNARVDCTRVEDLRPGPRVGRFDYIIARAVSSASKVIEWCGPLLASGGGADGGMDMNGREVIPGGSFILLKGGDLTSELAALGEAAGGATVTVRPLNVEGSGDLLTEKKVIIVTP